MSHAVVLQPAVPMRLEASDRSEMVSQMLFGDTCVVLHRTEKWSQVRCLFDGYEGWVDNKQIELLDESEFRDVCSWSRVVSTRFDIVRIDDSTIVVPMGALVPWGGPCRVAGFSVSSLDDDGGLCSTMVAASDELMGAPYLWGGKTLMGIDCSGFVQVCARAAGISLPRDASQQALVGQMVASIEDARPDDLCFFANEAGRVIHVGIYLGGGQIVHASGSVHVDSVDAKGIYSSKFARYTHILHSIRRIH